MRKLFCYVDESGTLPDPKDKVIILAAVGTFTPWRIEKFIKGIRKSRDLKANAGEVKFYTAGDKTKEKFFGFLSKEQVDIFILVVDKMGRRIADSPDNYAVLCWLLLRDVLDFYEEVDQVVMDRHFHRNKDLEGFNKRLMEMIQGNLMVEHVDRRENISVNVADMVAGAVLAKETGKDDCYYQMIRKKIIVEVKLNWPEAKRKLFRS